MFSSILPFSRLLSDAEGVGLFVHWKSGKLVRLYFNQKLGNNPLITSYDETG